MSARPSDPFDLLQQVPLREPDPARLEADAARARAEFLDAGAQQKRGWDWPAFLRGWRPRFAIPLGTGLVAGIVMGLWLALPGAGPDMGPDTGPDGQRLADESPASPGNRLGARSGPGPEAGSAEVSARYSFDGFDLLLREPPGQLVLSFAQDGQDLPFSTYVAEDGVEFRVLDAFIQPRAEQDPLLLVQSDYGGFTNWNAYEMGLGAITLSGRLSLLIHDAASREDLIARLAGTETAP